MESGGKMRSRGGSGCFASRRCARSGSHDEWCLVRSLGAPDGPSRCRVMRITREQRKKRRLGRATLGRHTSERTIRVGWALEGALAKIRSPPRFQRTAGPGRAVEDASAESLPPPHLQEHDVAWRRVKGCAGPRSTGRFLGFRVIRVSLHRDGPSGGPGSRLVPAVAAADRARDDGLETRNAPSRREPEGAFLIGAGDGLLSRVLSDGVPSAL